MHWWHLLVQGGIWLVWEPQEDWHFCSCHIVKIKIISIIVSGDSLKLYQCSLGWEFSSRIKTSRCETTGQNWSNMEQISTIYVILYLFLLHRRILILDFPRGLWWWLSSSIVPWSVIGSSPFLEMIHNFFHNVLEVYDRLVNLGFYQWHKVL